MITPHRVTSAVHAAPTVDTHRLALRPGWFHLARPGVSDRLIQPLLDAAAPVRPAGLDLDRGMYLPVPPWEVAVYRVTVDGRTQVGLILEVAIDDYLAGRIRPHEATRAHAVESLADHLVHSAVDVAPVTLAHRPDPEVASALAEVMNLPPTLAAVSRDAAEHSIWLVDAEWLAPVLDRLARSGSLYVVDGHHRCAAGALLAGHGPTRGAGEDARDHLFAFVIAQDQLEVASYHVVVRDVAEPCAEIVRRVGRELGTEPIPVGAREVARTEPGVVGMWCADRWFRLELGSRGPVGDADRVHAEILAPVFGITDPGRDRRLVHVPGTVSPGELQARCPEGTVAFVMHPPSAASLFATADEGRAVPAKSSLFHPKVPAGLFLRRRAAWSA